MGSLVTVAIPVYNRAIFLRDAIASVLAQEYSELELLIVDDASQENIEQIIRSYGYPNITYIRNDCNLGMVPNWNRCLSLASGDIVNILHSDDRLCPNAIRRAVDSFTSSRDVGLVCSGLNKAARYIPEGIGAAAACACGVAPVSSVFLNRQAVEACGPFDVSHPYSADMEFFPRVARSYGVMMIDGLAIDRNHSGRAMIKTWREKDFLPKYDGVRTAAWRHAGLDGRQLNQRVREDVSRDCRYIAEMLWKYGDRRSDNDLGRFYLSKSIELRSSETRASRGGDLLRSHAYEKAVKIGHVLSQARGLARVKRHRVA